MDDPVHDRVGMDAADPPMLVANSVLRAKFRRRLVVSAVDQLEHEPALFLAERVEDPFDYHFELCATCIEDLEDGRGIFIARR